MFKDLGNLFDIKNRNIKFSKNKNLEVREIFNDFLNKYYGNNLDKFNFIIEYNYLDKTLNIKTENKTIANELSFNLGNINIFFKTKGVQLNKILIK